MKSTVPFHAKVNDMAFSRDAWYAATEEGLVVSRDRGLNWTSVSLSPVHAGGGRHIRERVTGTRRSPQAMAIPMSGR